MASSRFTQELAMRICERMAEGKSLREVCRSEDIPVSESTVRFWAIHDVNGFAAQYACARDVQMDAMAEEILEISDASGFDVVIDEHGKYTAQGEVVQRAKLRVDSRKWLMSKVAPKKYGDKVIHAGDPENPQIIEHRNGADNFIDRVSDIAARRGVETGAQKPH